MGGDEVNYEREVMSGISWYGLRLCFWVVAFNAAVVVLSRVMPPIYHWMGWQ
jgi:hypothetical protein